jgi:nitrite reductase/ring-hydroxylating ferredoxin subunit
MAKKPKPVTAPYGAYYSRLDGASDDELTRVGRGTPCGEYLRRFWQPVAISEDLEDVPLAVRVLGEDLVVFRDGSGRIGVLEKRCCHRGASLEFGKIMERGLACCYHGWHYDIDGRILDTPGEPPDSPVKERICQGAYPARVREGLVFAYMGPPDRMPAFPLFDAFERADADYRLWTRHNPCNWLQVRENEMDPIHLTFLHTRLFGVQFTPVCGALPTLEWQEVDNGMISIATRRWKGRLYLRCNHMILPNVIRVAGIEDGEGEALFDRRGSSLNWVVPIDDTSCLTIGYSDIHKNVVHPNGEGYFDRMARRGDYAVGAADVGQTGEPSYAERQRAPGDWDAWVSQGPITHHDRETLASTDRGVVMFRNMLRQGIRKVAKGEKIDFLKPGADRVIPTYCHNTVIPVPGSDCETEERGLCLRFGRDITELVLANAFPKDERCGASPAALQNLRSRFNS